MRRIGFLVNPIAGMGGRVGLKGTDGVSEEAEAAGATPVAPGRAVQFLRAYEHIPPTSALEPIEWLTASSAMGEEELVEAGVPRARVRVVLATSGRTTAEDTKACVRRALEAGAQLLLFCGGDGTARDVADAAQGRAPILGIPSGVKMHSAVFAVDPAAAAALLRAYVLGELRAGDAEILDVDEEAYRRGEWKVRICATARTLVEPHLVAAGKTMSAEVSDADVRSELIEHFRELFQEEPVRLFLLGPGSTIESIAKGLGLKKTLLGIDAVIGGNVIARDLDERRILELLEKHPNATLAVSPIGAQGFVLGRGNLQVSPQVMRRIGLHNLLVVATPSKLAATPALRVDSGDEALDRELRAREYLFVLVGYRTTRLHSIQG
ncbi:MAG TPA: ATP-NAD kinase family protein [Thermoplasmata archaeon]